MGSNCLPDGYLQFCSLDALESLELARLNQAANLRKERMRVRRRGIASAKSGEHFRK